MDITDVNYVGHVDALRLPTVGSPADSIIGQNLQSFFSQNGLDYILRSDVTLFREKLEFELELVQLHTLRRYLDLDADDTDI